VGLDLRTLLTFSTEQGASDLHISAGHPPRIRNKGLLVGLDMAPLSSDETYEALCQIMTEEQKRHFEATLDIDFSIEIPGVSRYRVNIFVQRSGPAAVFRSIPAKILTLDELHMPKVLKTLALREKGLVVVTGPTGAGKSTTLAAMVDFVNETRASHILTVEDPIEFVHESKKCLVNQREVGNHTKSFANALRAALREDPDVILVGELRDLETTSLAITAAETGHLVLGTLHTNSAAKTIDRLIDVFPAGEQAQVRTMISESLEGIIAQTLLPSKDGQGRVAAVEILIGVPALRNLIREDKTAQILSVMQTGAQHGMQSLDQALQNLVMQGRLDRAEAMRVSSNPRLFEGAAGGTGGTSGGVGGGAGSGIGGGMSGGLSTPAARPAAGTQGSGPAPRPAPPKPKKTGLFSR
jgi:twitching motility protein PilT